MDINKTLGEYIKKALDNEGLFIELKKELKYNFFNVQMEAKEGNIKTYVLFENVDYELFLYKFVDMLKNNEITITFNENADKESIEYLERLYKSECLHKWLNKELKEKKPEVKNE